MTARYRITARRGDETGYYTGRHGPDRFLSPEPQDAWTYTHRLGAEHQARGLEAIHYNWLFTVEEAGHGSR